MSQKSRIIDLLSDKAPHGVNEVLNYVYGSERNSAANLTGRISELRGKGYDIKCYEDVNRRSFSWYRLLGKKETPQMADWKRTKLKQPEASSVFSPSKIAADLREKQKLI